ncbi:MAG: EAL domain-containing protein [Lachnospiraceae bacterium]|nr:EAL domain-containing protein [Lachnospiraceae bacterium]
MLYNIHYDIAAIVISLFIIFYISVKKGLKSASNRIFLALVISNLFAAFFDIISSVLNSYPDITALWKADIANSLYLAFHNTMTPLLLFYILCLIGGISVRGRIKRFILVIPLLADYVLLLLNLRFRFVYYYDENGIYLHGPLFVFFYCVAFGYMSASVFLLIVKRTNIARSKRYALIFIILATIASLVIQMVYTHLLLEIFAQTIGFLGILLSIENQDDIINPITRVYNRYAFMETVPEVIGNKSCVFIVIKLPELAYYNTTIGVMRTNEYLRRMAAFLSGVDSRLLCYDMGGGSFVLTGSMVQEDELEAIAGRIEDRFRAIWGQKGSGVSFSAAICAGSADRISSVEELLLIIDSQDDIKETERVGIEDIVEKHKRRILIESILRRAIANREFQVYYQPIWERKSGRFHSAEALIRLKTAEFGFISPEEFIPIAEESGQIVEIGAFVFDEVCRFYKSHELEKLGVDYVEVNLSTVQCMDPELVQSFKETLRKYQILPERMNLEITESAAADNRRILKDNVNVLNGLGFSFSLDDYGTGYSNFSYMFDLPFSIIKLDKSILWRALHPTKGEGSKSSGILLSNTIRMMKEMGYHVLVEGVETAEQKLLLEKLSCDYF